ncbi:MAG: hypothetical protein ACRDQF_22000 [Thermocrispum sp.]
MIFDQLQLEWSATVGGERLAAVAACLREVVPAEGFRLDVPGWLGTPR